MKRQHRLAAMGLSLGLCLGVSAPYALAQDSAASAVDRPAHEIKSTEAGAQREPATKEQEPEVALQPVEARAAAETQAAAEPAAATQAQPLTALESEEQAQPAVTPAQDTPKLRARREATPSESAEQFISLSNSIIKAAANKEIAQQTQTERTDNQDITAAEARLVRDLRFTRSKELHSLEGLENFTELRNLDISYTDVSDLSPVASLTKLINIQMHQIKATDLSPLRTTKNLRVLAAYGLAATNFDFLKDLKLLQNIQLRDTSFSDLSLVKDALMLDHIDAGDSRSEGLTEFDLSQLAKLKRLEHLSFNQAKILHMDKMPKLVDTIRSLFSLTGSDKQGFTPEELEKIKDVRTLTVSKSGLTSIDFINELPKLTRLNVSDNPIGDNIELLKDRTLSSLNLDGIGLHSIEALRGKTYSSLDLSRNHILDYTPLTEQMKSKKYLQARDNTVDLTVPFTNFDLDFKLPEGETFLFYFSPDGKSTFIRSGELSVSWKDLDPSKKQLDEPIQLSAHNGRIVLKITVNRLDLDTTASSVSLQDESGAKPEELDNLQPLKVTGKLVLENGEPLEVGKFILELPDGKGGLIHKKVHLNDAQELVDSTTNALVELSPSYSAEPQSLKLYLDYGAPLTELLAHEPVLTNEFNTKPEEKRKTIPVWSGTESRVELSEGEKLADGTDAHTVTVYLVNTYGEPIVGKADQLVLYPAASEDFVVQGENQNLFATAFEELADKPGVYRAKLTATQAGHAGAGLFYLDPAMQPLNIANPEFTFAPLVEPVPDPGQPTEPVKPLLPGNSQPEGESDSLPSDKNESQPENLDVISGDSFADSTKLSSRKVARPLPKTSDGRLLGLELAAFVTGLSLIAGVALRGIWRKGRS